MRIVEQPTSLGDSWRIPLHFQHFRSEKIESLLHHVCQLLGFYGGEMFYGSKPEYIIRVMESFILLSISPLFSPLIPLTSLLPPGSLPVLLDHLTDVFRGSTLWQKETTIMISHLLLGASGRECVQGRGKVGILL